MCSYQLLKNVKGEICLIDKNTAENIAEKYYDDIYKICLSRLNHNENIAEEITQEVFLLFQEKSEELEDKNIKGWLRRTAENKVSEYFRAAKKDDAVLNFEDENYSCDVDEAFLLFEECFPLSDEEIDKYKDIVLKSLTKKEQELYNKIYIEKKKYKEIAEELNTTEKVINLRAFRLRKKIRTLAKLMLTSVGQLIIKIFF